MLDYFVTTFFAAAAFFAIYKIKMFGAKGISKHWFAGAFALKLIAAFAMWFIYTYHYTDRSKADIFRYYDDAKVFQHLLKDYKMEYFHFFYQEKSSDEEVNVVLKYTNNWDMQNKSSLFGSNKLMIRTNMLLNLFSLGSYGVHAIVFSFLAFMGLFWIFRFFYRQTPERKWLIFLAVFGFPSIVFWSSGILKESLVIFFIGLILNCGSYALRGKKPIIRSIVVLIAFVLLFQTRAIIALILSPMTIAYIWNYIKPHRRVFLPYFILLFLALSIITESKKITGKDFYGILYEKRMAFEELANQEDSGSAIIGIQFDADGLSILKSAPIALINSIFRPAPWEAKNMLMWAASLENILLFVLLILLVIYPSPNIKNKNLLWFALLFALANLIVVGLTSPILGAISRYRIIGLLFFLMAYIQLIDYNKILNKQ
ncbi:MAG: hypothetical protein DSY76_04715 [Bacteroidetes bacterium]|nr:MAG: hypothetical protein DSY76_04715 [Bacteroidota bacterium]